MRHIKRRYLAVMAESDDRIDERELIKAVWGMIYQLFGEYGASQVGMFHIDLQDDKEIAVLRCSHTAIDMVRAAIAVISQISNRPVALRVVAISGTLKALRRKIHHLKKK